MRIVREGGEKSRNRSFFMNYRVYFFTYSTNFTFSFGFTYLFIKILFQPLQIILGGKYSSALSKI